MTGFADDIQLTVVVLYILFGQGQPQAGAGLFCGEERIHASCDGVFCHAHTLIPNGDHAAGVLTVQGDSQCEGGFFGRGSQLFPHGFDAVHGDVDQHLLDLVPVGDDAVARLNIVCDRDLTDLIGVPGEEHGFPHKR